jgi:ribosomal-protein-alanine N-acetyltransferase
MYGEVIGLLRNFSVPSGRIYKIGVHPEMKKRGIGSFLIKAIEKWFMESGMKKSCAEIRESNSASRGMFQRNGYLETGFRPFYYAGGENAVKCWKDL